MVDFTVNGRTFRTTKLPTEILTSPFDVVNALFQSIECEVELGVWAPLVTSDGVAALIELRDIRKLNRIALMGAAIYLEQSMDRSLIGARMQ
jgi:hypothetical protein